MDDGDVGRTEQLARFRAPGRLLISESSIRDARDVERAGRSGADAVLVGTSVLKASRVEEILGELTSVRWPVG